MSAENVPLCQLHVEFVARNFMCQDSGNVQWGFQQA